LPLYLLTWKIAPAIAFGNTAVCKPSELTPMTAFLLGQVLNEAGLPKGVCNIIHGLGSKAGEALVTHPQVKLVSFTGGTKTGRHIAELCARDLKRASLELGGKNPGIIFADADLGECIPTTIRSSFQNQGEICLCNSRLYVEKSLFPEFIERFSTFSRRAAKPGDPLSDSSFLGPLVSLEHREKVKSYIDLARSEGASFHLGGGIPTLPEPFSGGYFLEPTIISGVSPTSRLQTEEIFGPVVTVTPFEDEAEAIQLANSTEYGLSASVWTQDEAKANRVARAIESGTVWINTWMLRDLNSPFGGMKKSGWGREGADWSLDFYTETKNICSKPSPNQTRTSP
jgi:aminomuconate-semialdehyde/2-hydroxymuconate-6-semialdehyde dehydrogenase